MEESSFDRLVDYFPLLALFGFWFQAAFMGALIIGEPELIALGLVTLPALTALALAARKVRKIRRAQRAGR